jgi:uncharacterized protein YndB with AHSA1/START domain
METTAQKITVQTLIDAPVSKVWTIFNAPEHITQWATASEDWHTPSSENDLRVGGSFRSTMAAKDGSFSFEFGGVYTKVDPEQYIEYNMSDGRNVSVTFTEEGDSTSVVEVFDAESTNPIEMQQFGWQAILNNLKKHVESV